jgi:hypothetical protein
VPPQLPPPAMPPFMPPPPLFQRVFYRILQTTPVVSSFEIWAGLSRFEQFEVHDFFLYCNYFV